MVVADRVLTAATTTVLASPSVQIHFSTHAESRPGVYHFARADLLMSQQEKYQFLRSQRPLGACRASRYIVIMVQRSQKRRAAEARPPARSAASRQTVERVQTGVRLEKRLLKVLKALAEYHDLSLGDLLEGIVLHAFEGKCAFDERSLRTIADLRRVYGLTLDASMSHRLEEAAGE